MRRKFDRCVFNVRFKRVLLFLTLDALPQTNLKDDDAKMLEQRTEEEIKALHETVRAGKDDVIAMLLDCVKTVNLDYEEHDKKKKF